MKNYYVEGQWDVICQRCGFKHKSGELKQEWTGQRVCKECWEPRHSSDLLRVRSDNEGAVPWSSPEPPDVFTNISYTNTDDPYWSSVILRLPFDGSYNNVAPSGITVNPLSSSLNTSFWKFGSGCLSLNGTNGSMVTNDNALFDFSNTALDFTDEFWFYPDTDNNGGLIHQIYKDNGNRIHVGYDPTNQFVGIEMVQAFAVTDYNAPANSAKKGQWNKLVIQRAAGVVTFSVNGVAFFSGTPARAFPSAQRIEFGALVSTSQYYFKGKVDDVRITRGVARYNHPFVPEAVALPIS